MTRTSSPSYRRLAEEDRRQLLVDAAISVLSECGLGGTTVRKIAARAGVTPGLVTHYFSGKEALVSSAYRFLAEKYHRDYVAASDAAGSDPLERLKAYVGSAFQPETLNADLLRVWTSFWTSALTDRDSEAAKVHHETAQQARAYLKQLIREALSSAERDPDESEINDMAIAAWSLLDGMWLSWGLDPSLFAADEGRRIVFDVLATRLCIPAIASPMSAVHEPVVPGGAM